MFGGSSQKIILSAGIIYYYVKNIAPLVVYCAIITFSNPKLSLVFALINNRLFTRAFVPVMIVQKKQTDELPAHILKEKISMSQFV